MISLFLMLSVGQADHSTTVNMAVGVGGGGQILCTQAEIYSLCLFCNNQIIK